MIARILAMAFGLAGALVASQGPEFAQQYRQRLGGAIDELRRVVQRFETDARATGRTPEEARQRLSGDTDELVRRQSEAMRDHADRLARLERQQAAFNQAGSFERLLVFLKGSDPELDRATFQTFEPAVPATPEGLVSAGLGFLICWGAMLFTGRSIGKVVYGRRRRRAPDTVRV